MTIARALAQSEHLLEQLKASIRPDPLALLTPYQQAFYRKWWGDFRERNSKTPEALYEAVINYRGWTPNEWLSRPIITTDMSETEAAQIWAQCLEGR